MKTKICTKCKVRQPVSKFYKNKATKDGLCSWCSACKAKYQRENPEVSRKSNKKSKLKQKYGLTIARKQEMYANQNGKCLLCDKLKTYEDMVVDHDHQLGYVRGLLCRHCNTSLGWFENRKGKILSYIGV